MAGEPLKPFCCQCTCPVLSDGTRRHAPDHGRPFKDDGRETRKEFEQRQTEFRESLPMGTSTRCEYHNGPESIERRG